MSYFTNEEKSFFKQNGYVVKHNVVPKDQIENAKDVLWDHIEADRNDPKSWIDAGPKGNLPCSDEPAIISTLHDNPTYDMAEELVGKGRMRPPGKPLCKMNFPTGHKNWTPPRGHLDGYLTDGVAGTFTIAVTLNVSDIILQGGGFTTWGGSHLKVAEYFRHHPITHGWKINKGEVPELTNLPNRYEHAAPAGSIVFWHHYMLHTASMNCQDTIRMALVSRFSFHNLNDIMFDLPHNMWDQWDGLKDVA
jgi:hypothetical protein